MHGSSGASAAGIGDVPACKRWHLVRKTTGRWSVQYSTSPGHWIGRRQPDTLMLAVVTSTYDHAAFMVTTCRDPQIVSLLGALLACCTTCTCSVHLTRCDASDVRINCSHRQPLWRAELAKQDANCGTRSGSVRELHSCRPVAVCRACGSQPDRRASSVGGHGGTSHTHMPACHPYAEVGVP